MSEKAQGIDVADQKNDYAMESVPEHAKASLIDMCFLYAGYVITAFAPIYGGIIAGVFDFWSGFWILAIGAGILSFFSAMQAMIGSDSGFSTMRLAQHVFGSSGVKFPAFMWGFAFIVWNAVIIGLQAYMAPVPWQLGPLSSTAVMAILSILYGIVFCAASIWGLKVMAWISKIGVPATMLVLLLGLIMGLQRAGGFGQMLLSQPTAPGGMSIGLGIGLGIASWLMGSTTVPDITRFAKNRTHATLVVIIAMFLANMFMLFLGMVTVLSVGESDLGRAFAVLFSGWLIPVAWFCIMVSMWTTAQVEIYASSLAWTNVFPIKRHYLAIITSAIAIILSAIVIIAGAMNSTMNWMNALGIIYPGLVGTIIADYWIVHRQKLAPLQPMRIRSLVSWAATVVITLIISQVLKLEGLAWLYMSPAVGVVIHTLLHIPEMASQPESCRSEITPKEIS